MPKKLTLCWDCARACGGCCWSRAVDPDPVPGWAARPTINANGTHSFFVTDCPLFERDAWDGGTRRTPPLTDDQRAAKRRQQYKLSKCRRRIPTSSAGWAEAALRCAGGEE